MSVLVEVFQMMMSSNVFWQTHCNRHSQKLLDSVTWHCDQKKCRKWTKLSTDVHLPQGSDPKILLMCDKSWKLWPKYFPPEKRGTRGQPFFFFPTLLKDLIGSFFCAPIGQPALVNINKAALPHSVFKISFYKEQSKKSFKCRQTWNGYIIIIRPIVKIKQIFHR